MNRTGMRKNNAWAPDLRKPASSLDVCRKRPKLRVRTHPSLKVMRTAFGQGPKTSTVKALEAGVFDRSFQTPLPERFR
jgi:hypothetical protein